MLNGRGNGPPDPARLFAGYEDGGPILAAVSGGPDSMALMGLLAAWAPTGRKPGIFVATVDHGMRAGSLDEAQMVAREAARLGLAHHILVWRGHKPVSRIQEAARDARYGLLSAHAGEIGARVLLTAHHADDQAETILFRLLRGSGPAGLAGMAAQSRRGALLHGRPLLALGKADLVAFCKMAGLPFADDPSNRNPRFARTKLRGLLRTLESEGLGVDDWRRLALRAARAEEALRQAADDARRGLTLREAGARRDARGLSAMPEEIVLRVLTGLIGEATGSTRPPRLDRVEHLTTRVLAALRAGAPLRANLAGALVDLDAAGGLAIRPEPPRRSGRLDDQQHVALDAGDAHASSGGQVRAAHPPD